MNYHELKPQEASIKVGGKDYNLRPFDLAAQVWAYNFFSTEKEKDGMKILADRISDIRDADCILNLTWHLLRRKVDFGSYDNFVKAVEKDQEQGKWNLIVSFYQAVVKTLGASQPDIEELKEEIELKKSLAAGD